MLFLLNVRIPIYIYIYIYIHLLWAIMPKKTSYDIESKTIETSRLLLTSEKCMNTGSIGYTEQGH